MCKAAANKWNILLAYHLHEAQIISCKIDLAFVAR